MPSSFSIPTSRLSRLAIAVIIGGFLVFLIGVSPDVVRLDVTPGVGILQIGMFLVGLTIMTIGAYMYVYATRHRAQTPRLREDIGVRLMATGLVVTYATGFADVLGIGSHYGVERPLFGMFQAAGVAGGVLVIILGILIYSRR